MNEEITENEIIEDNRENNILEFLDKCKDDKFIDNIEENILPSEILAIFEKLQLKKQDNTENNITNNDIVNISGITIEDIKDINEKAIKQVSKYVDDKFNMANPIHKEYFEYFKKELINEREKEIKIKEFEDSLHNKYGKMYAQVEESARDTFENMAYKDAKNIILSRMQGDTETLIKFYDDIYNKLTEQKEDMNMDSIKEQAIFPPKAMKSGNFASREHKIKDYSNFI